MGRIAIVIGLIALGVGFAWMQFGQSHKIVVSEATISRMMDGSIMASAKISNDGAPDVLLGATANGFGHVHFMNAQGDLVVPGKASATLAGDGAHVMMMEGDANLSLGELVPIVLTFKSAGKIAARAQVVDSVMDHSNMMGLEAPSINMSLRVEAAPGLEGAIGLVDFEGINVVARADGTPHKDGEGHAHVYLNGLKLQRLYEPRFETGTLLSGRYVLRVSVNSNDHRPYVKDGKPIAVEVEFTVK